MVPKKKTPSLRFPEFEGYWEVKKIEQIVKRVSLPVNVEETTSYQQIGIRSHGKGIFHKEAVSGKALGEKRVFWVQPNMLVVNIVFAWEQAIAKTTTNEIGMIASHRFPMYEPLKNLSELNYILYFFLTKKGKALLELASPGGAGRNKTLGQKEFELLKINVPTLPEQQKIATFLTAIDTRIQQLTRKKDLLEQYKKGVMQRIFSREIRFKDEDGREYGEWGVKKLGKITISIKNGLSLDQNSEKIGYKVTRIETISNRQIDIEKVGYVMTSKDISSYKLGIGDLLFSNINSVSHVGKVAFIDKDYDLYHGMNLLNIRANKSLCDEKFLYYQLSSVKLKRYFERICNQAVSQASINQSDLKETKLPLPSLPEQQKIATFLTALDARINQVSDQLVQTRAYKKGLFQRMFV
jgi:type I restriction enzyme S subunit